MNIMKKIIIDTNALMGIASLNIDLFAAIEEAIDFPHQILILEGTIDELRKIEKEQSGKEKAAAKLALQIITNKKISLLPEIGYVDDLLIKHSRAGDLILTQDIALKKRLQEPYLTIRQKKKVIVIG